LPVKLNGKNSCCTGLKHIPLLEAGQGYTALASSFTFSPNTYTKKKKIYFIIMYERWDVNLM